jgi:diguanylate cyclase (GGDEF)-like protein/PAS domain S-box-containing protein
MLEKNQLYENMLKNMYEGVYFVDNERKITFWNKGAERISGFTSDEILNHHCYDNILNHVDNSGKQLCKMGCPLQKTITDGQIRETGIFLHHKEGHRVAVSVRTIPIYDKDEIAGAVEVFVDDSNKAELLRNLDEMKVIALYDQLTELPNRRYINTFFESRIRELRELNIPFGVLMMDIDHFKKFNDEHGHDVGDEVLKMVSKTFRSVFRKNDMIGRWGGEEFVAIVTGINQWELMEIAERARMLVANSKLRNNGKTLKVNISLGATLAKVGESQDEIMKRADEALYESKENGRNQVTLK